MALWLAFPFVLVAAAAMSGCSGSSDEEPVLRGDSTKDVASASEQTAPPEGESGAERPGSRQAGATLVRREHPYSGLVAGFPFVGTMTWRCDGRRYSTALTQRRLGATVLVDVDMGDRRIWNDRRVNGGETLATPLVAARRQTWTIRYHHKPATLKVVARLRFAARGYECLVRRTKVQVLRTPH